MKMLDLAPEADWRKRFRAALVGGTQIARMNPKRGLAVSNLSGIYQLHSWDVETGELRQVTNAPAGVVVGGIAADGSAIYYLQDQKGDEIGHYVRVPFDGDYNTPVEDLTPDMPNYASFYIGQSLSARWIGLTTAGADGFQMWVIGPDQSSQLIYRSQRLSFGPMLSFDGEYAVIATTERHQFNNLSLMAFDLRAQSDSQKVLILSEDDGSIEPVAFSPRPDDVRLLASTNVTGFDRPLIWDVSTGDRTDLPFVGMDGDIQAWGWSPDGTKLLLCQFVQAHYQLYVYDLDHSTLHKLDHPSGTYNSGYFYSDREIFVNRQDSITPTQVVALDAQTGAQTRVVLRLPQDIPPSRPWRSVTFPSSGGQQIQAWIATPEGEGPFPTILYTHGGPTSVQTETFYPSAQAWLDHGFAFVSVNYRGSVTFGRQFEQAIWGKLGELEVDDMVAARHYLVTHRIADPDAILLTGGSYGGYLTLQAIGKTPDLWAGGMAVVAIADWRLMYEDQAETLRGYQRSLFGGSPDDLPEQHAKSSPITYADQIKAPILVIQGKNDTRCPARQMEVYEQTLKERGKAIEIEWFDAGHGSRAMEQSIHHQELMLRWAYRILG
ncbi:MAG: prolyl oligopeptidase family serine peptidase [Anaerolineae bacterium]|jgi:dipeptidyl aminopeptidase/acylaminoacyl peptidase|nr:prolyl oligopeptidase family serine peptidase [Anaerolineae bacterium]